MKWAWMALPFLALTLTACDSGGSADSTPAASPTTVLTAVPDVPVPDPPASLADYPQALADYATAVPGAAAACLSSVFVAWSMPSLTADKGCRSANTDADDDLELVVAVSADVLDPLSGVTVPSFLVAVLDPVGQGYVPAFQSSIYPLPTDTDQASPILDAGDLNADGKGEFAFASQFCGESACLDLAYILEGNGDGYEAIGPQDGIGIAEGTFEFIDEGGDGSKELLATGGAIATAESGPQRPRTEVWAWDGSTYSLSETRPGESQYLYHRILDADALLAASDYAGAIAAYQASAADQALLLWKPDQAEREELRAYALYRVALAQLLSSGDATAANASLDEAKAISGTLHAQLAAAFQAGYAAKGEVGVGCAAVQDDVRLNEPEYAAFWDFGDGEPAVRPAKRLPVLAHHPTSEHQAAHCNSTSQRHEEGPDQERVSFSVACLAVAGGRQRSAAAAARRGGY